MIGQITGAVGLKGELRIYSYTQEPSRWQNLAMLYVANRAADALGADKGGRADTAAEEIPEMDEVSARRVEHVRYKGEIPIVKLSEIGDRTAAESLRFHYVYMDAAELPRLPEGEYYVRELLGADVVTEDGALLGILTDIRTDTPQKLYQVALTGGGECLIPGVPAFILSRSKEEKRIVVRIPEGLLSL